MDATSTNPLSGDDVLLDDNCSSDYAQGTQERI